ncbi:MAG: hypothetical protein KBI32_02770 [Phycisphaerae bacterium]|nr:hypothetical protein [Syntrophobacterales bacterium]MBP8910413.1 hypothetical protein [Phycisphaerae bacterium]
MKWILKKYPLSIRPYCIDCLLIIFLVTCSLIGMWNFDVNMATLHEDDGPIFYSYAFKDPSLFEGDFPIGFPLSLLVPLKVMTSAMVWIPAMSWKYLDIDPFLSTGILTALQGFLLGLSVYVFSFTLVRNRVAALLATVFMYASSPWTWAPAGFGNISTFHFLPYAATMATSPILFAFVCVLKKRVHWALLLLALAGLIHPGITLHACIILGICLLFRTIGTSEKSQLSWQMTGLAAVALVTLGPSLWMQATVHFDPSDTMETIAGMKHNQHLWPWEFKNRWYLSWAVIVIWMIFALFSLRVKERFTDGALMLCFSAFIGACIMGLSQIIGGFLEFPVLLNFIGLRSFRWVILFSLPLIIYYWLSILRSGNWAGSMAVLFCIAVPLFVQEYAAFFFCPVIFALLFIEAGRRLMPSVRPGAGGKSALIPISITMAALGTVLAVTVIPFIRNVYAANSHQLQQAISKFTWPLGAVNPPRLILFLTILAVLAALLSRYARTTQPEQPDVHNRPSGYKCRSAVMSLLVIVYSLCFLMIEWKTTAGQSAAEGRSMIEAQTWAKEETPKTSVFVVPSVGWRAMSLRRKVDPFPRESYAYVAPRQVREYRDRLLRFYGITEDEGRRIRGYGPGGVYELVKARFSGFNEPDFLRFATEFGASYLVLPLNSPVTQRTDLALPVAYRNDHYVIYSLAAHS